MNIVTSLSELTGSEQRRAAATAIPRGASGQQAARTAGTLRILQHNISQHVLCCAIGSHVSAVRDQLEMRAEFGQDSAMR